jgi:hypothetical protein
MSIGVRVASLGIVLGLSAAPHAQTPRAPGCEAPEFRHLAYWIGAWDVRTKQDEQAGASVIEWSADGCSILERWTSVPGMPRFAGTGLHFYDPATKTYRQIWSDTRPAIVDMRGTPLNDGFRYDWKVTSPQGQLLDKRYTLTQTDGGGVRQLGERSADGGKTWTVEYEYRYRRH